MKMTPKILFLVILSFNVACTETSHNKAGSSMNFVEEENVIKVLPDIKYGKENRQYLDIYLPVKTGNHPVLFFIHGGAWSTGDKDMYGSIGYFYAKKGYVTILADHRLSPDVAYPTHIQDVAKAFAWVMNNVHKYGGDTNKVYICGHSSGAHLVSLLATNKKYLLKEGADVTDIKGVITVSGIYSLGTNVRLAGCNNIFPTKEARYDASPINFVSKSTPPFLIIHAENDIITLSSQATDFHKVLSSKGVRSRLSRAKEKNHITILLDCVSITGSAKTILNFME